MSLLDVGYGATSGLEVLLARMRADEALKQRDKALEEESRSNKAREEIARESALETKALRGDAQRATQQQHAFTQAQQRQGEYAIGQDVPVPEAAANVQAGLSPSVYKVPSSTVTSTIGLMSLPDVKSSMQGGQSATIPMQSVTSTEKSQLQEPPTFVTYQGTGKEQLAAKKEAAAEDKANRAKPPTEGEMDAAFQALDAKRNTGQKLTPDEQANYDAYIRRKTVGIDTSAGYAADRQTANEKFRRSQDFAKVKQTYRKDYESAAMTAGSLRDLAVAATSGNQVAANVVPMAGALAIVTPMGVHRINTTEINAVGGGSLLRRIQTSLEKAATGQIPDGLKNDLTQLANLMQQSAYKRYKRLVESGARDYGVDANVEPMEVDNPITDIGTANQMPGGSGASANAAPLDPTVAALLARKPGAK